MKVFVWFFWHYGSFMQIKTNLKKDIQFKRDFLLLWASRIKSEFNLASSDQQPP